MNFKYKVNVIFSLFSLWHSFITVNKIIKMNRDFCYKIRILNSRNLLYNIKQDNTVEPVYIKATQRNLKMWPL